MPRRSRDASPRIYQLKVSLAEIEPLVWRRLLVPSAITLAKLHSVLQEAMGWTNSHLHQFTSRNRLFGNPAHDKDGELALEDERKVKLDELVGEGQSLLYEYDFGDGWSHEVLVEKVLAPDERLSYPLCIGGARACPPEDCGGPPGYENLLAAVAHPEHEDHDDIVRWVGGYFDPEAFDTNRVNATLRAMR
jgi:hypothetical protein